MHTTQSYHWNINFTEVSENHRVCSMASMAFLTFVLVRPCQFTLYTISNIYTHPSHTPVEVQNVALTLNTPDWLLVGHHRDLTSLSCTVKSPVSTERIIIIPEQNFSISPSSEATTLLSELKEGSKTARQTIQSSGDILPSVFLPVINRGPLKPRIFWS